MLYRSLLVIAVLSFKQVSVQAQGLLLPSPLPGHAAENWRLPAPVFPGGALVATLAAAPIPTMGAAASYPSLNAPVRRLDQVLPVNQLVYYQQTAPVATGASLVGAVAGWLLGADPRVQAYQQNRQFTGRDNILPVPCQARPNDLLR